MTKVTYEDILSEMQQIYSKQNENFISTMATLHRHKTYQEITGTTTMRKLII